MAVDGDDGGDGIGEKKRQEQDCYLTYLLVYLVQKMMVMKFAKTKLNKDQRHI